MQTIRSQHTLPVLHEAFAPVSQESAKQVRKGEGGRRRRREGGCAVSEQVAVRRGTLVSA